MIRRTALFVLAWLAIAPIAFCAEIPEKSPAADAKPHTWFQSKSKGDLRYAWLVPKGYDGKTARNLTVILHGTGLDYRWGPANNPAGVFRPDDVVVSVDGPSPGPNDSRLFLGEKKDAQAVAAFLDEMRAAFAIERVFLYGHSQGGFFVVYFAGEYPTAVAGVVAHASGAWNWSKMGAPVKKVAIAFQHGTLDPVVPYPQSPGSRDAYAKAGFELLHLRRLETYNHWPNAVRSTESLDWCEGMTTSSPERALEIAQRILTPKKPDEYQWQTAVGFAGARDVLRRLEKQGPVPFSDTPDDVPKNATSAIAKVEAEGAKHVAALEKDVKARKDLNLKSADWLGHLIALREDFRGVDSVEAYIKRIGYDAELASQQKAVRSRRLGTARARRDRPTKRSSRTSAMRSSSRDCRRRWRSGWGPGNARRKASASTRSCRRSTPCSSRGKMVGRTAVRATARFGRIGRDPDRRPEGPVGKPRNRP